MPPPAGPCYVPPVDENEIETEEVPPYVRFLAAAIERAVADLTKRERIELEEEHRLPLISELIAKAAQAETPKRMLKALVRGLVNSEHVEEIYASDDELKDAMKKHLEVD